MSTQPVDIQIFGRMLRVNCPLEQQQALHQSANELSRRLTELKARTGVNNTEQLVFIAALNICHELEQERLKNCDNTLIIEQRAQALLQTVEQALVRQRSKKKSQDSIFE